MLFFVATIFAFSLAFAAVAQETGGVPAPAAAEERLAIETKDKASPAFKGLKLEKEVRPRLPNGYSPVVDTSQREQIYKILQEYNELIAMLELRVELLKKERDAKVEGVLSPVQLERIRRPQPRGSEVLQR